MIVPFPKSARIVIPGGGGLVGRVLAEKARGRDRDVRALSSSQWDITDPAAAERHVAAGDVVINCAAYTRVDAAETDRDRARAVNADGPGHIARACARVGARLIQLSTDYVFSGRFDGPPRPYEIDDETDPISVYGRTKLDGERAVLAALPEATVVRTAWIYQGRDGADFAAVMRRAAAGDGTVEVVADQVGSPTYVDDLVDALLQIVDDDIRAPVLHVVNEGPASRFDQARAVFEAVGADPSRVLPVDSTRHPRPAPRPMYSALSMAKSVAAGLTPLRPWRAAIAAAIGPLPSTP